MRIEQGTVVTYKLPTNQCTLKRDRWKERRAGILFEVGEARWWRSLEVQRVARCTAASSNVDRVCFYSHQFVVIFHEGGYELHSLVADDLSEFPMQSLHMVTKNLSYSQQGDIIGGNKVSHFGELVDDDTNSVVILRLGERSNQINRNDLL